MAPRRVCITFSEDIARAPEDLPAGNQLLEAMPRLWSLRVKGALGPLIQLLSGLPVKDVSIDEPRLEDVLMDYYREEKS